MKLMMVIPCYNEELVLHETTRQLMRVLDGLQAKKQMDAWEILYVDDGSKDNSLQVVPLIGGQQVAPLDEGLLVFFQDLDC